MLTCIIPVSRVIGPVHVVALSADTLTRPDIAVPTRPQIGSETILRVGSGFKMPSQDRHARYEDRSSEIYSRVFETANTDLQDPQNPRYESAASSNLQNPTDVAAPGTSRALFFPTTAPAFNGSWDAAKSMSGTTVGS